MFQLTKILQFYLLKSSMFPVVETSSHQWKNTFYKKKHTSVRRWVLTISKLVSSNGDTNDPITTTTVCTSGKMCFRW